MTSNLGDVDRVIAHCQKVQQERDELRAKVEQLKAQLREGNARFDATVEAVVAERWKEWQRWRAQDVDERCPSCGEISAKTLMCRSCTLEQNTQDREDFEENVVK